MPQETPASGGVRSWLFGLLMTVLCLPVLNHAFGFVESPPLKGDVRLAADTNFTPAGWFSGAYQQKKEAYLNDHTGFRADLVRFNNQLDYTLFTQFHAKNVVQGKNGYLYEGGYIDALYGRDYVGDSALASQLSRLRYIQDTLRRAGKQLILALAPSKARFYSEYIPDSMKPAQPVAKTNYTEIRRRSLELGIELIDFNAWYLTQKSKYPGKLFSKGGTHWSYFGADLAADTFHRQLEALLGIDMPDMKIVRTECDQPARESDKDIVTALNLIWPVTEDRMCYNVLDFSVDSANKQKPDMVFISDSFFWLWMYDYIPQNAYNHWQAWFYFAEAWGGRREDQFLTGTSLRTLDWMDEINKADAVVLLFTEANLSRLGAGFIDAAYEKLQPALRR